MLEPTVSILYTSSEIKFMTLLVNYQYIYIQRYCHYNIFFTQIVVQLLKITHTFM